jgi:hypothetical protein
MSDMGGGGIAFQRPSSAFDVACATDSDTCDAMGAGLVSRGGGSGEGSRMTSGGSMGKGGAGGCSSLWAGAAVSGNVDVVGAKFKAGSEAPALGGGLASRGAG